MTLALEAQERSVLPQLPKRDEELLRLFDGTPVVLFVGGDEDRRRDILHVLKRGVFQEGRWIVPRVCAPLDLAPRRADVTRAVKTVDVANTDFGHRAAEPIRVRDEPVRHEASVGAPGHRRTFGIDEALSEYVI